jgi:invasion protein IalB
MEQRRPAAMVLSSLRKGSSFCEAWFPRRGGVPFRVIIVLSFAIASHVSILAKFAIAAEPEAPTDFGSWMLSCREVSRPTFSDCAVSQGIESDKDPAVWADIIAAYNKHFQLMLRVVLPSDLVPEQGLGVGVDARQIALLGFKACSSAKKSCIAEGALDSSAWGHLYQGSEVTIVFHQTSEQASALTTSLKGFEAAVGVLGKRIAIRPPPPIANSPSDWRNVYVVREGDSLSGISRKHGVGTAELEKFNGLKGSAILLPGTALMVPRPWTEDIRVAK